MPLLLVGFLLFLSSRFPAVAGLAIELPAGFPSLAEPRGADVAVAVMGLGHYVCGDLLLDGDGLAAALARSEKKGTVLLHCDRRTPLEDLLRAAEIAKKGNFGAIQVAIAP
ncbi:MAG: hypothetical protein LBF24_02605 [Puniceicoccales bacterium]|jgi:biopolymer transport protein ExbD|nr:hypothetical protein [Puniceicoccales bacterium]